MGISAAMTVGSSGLRAFQVASEVTSQNIANVNTPGYSRQRVVLESAIPTSHNGFAIGSGVQIATVERYYDSLLQQQIVNAQTSQGFDTTKSTVLQQLEPSFNDIANDGIGTAVSKFFGAWQDLTLNPAGTSERQVVLTRAQVLVDNFHSVSKSLTDSISLQNAALTPLTDGINKILTNIASINDQIKTTQTLNGNPNELKDQRDQLIRDLSTKIGITFTENSDGTTDVKLNETGTPALVTGSTAGAFSLVVNGTKSDVYLNPAGGAGAVILAPQPTKGQLGATINLRDTIIPGYLKKVDDLANGIATAVNTQHQAGFDLNATAGIAFFSPVTDAATIAINPALNSTRLIAAAGANPNAPPAALPGDNSNALAMAKLQNSTTAAVAKIGSVTFNSYYSSFVSSVGLDVQSSKTTVTQDEAFVKQLTTLRDSNSAVSLDEELTNLMKYQRAYQASAKIVSTVTDMMDVAMGMIR
ncbi:MAG TPA: flagellar hook-associated protein FlgK [Desulfuromonadales bacterium]|nr:flagellar hook-associated protein FlgK [Desulfuromonadales bacterium]